MYGNRIPPASEPLDGTAVLARMIDGLAFRYHWATDGLRSEDFDFRPGLDCMSARELQEHVLYLALMIHQTVFDAAERGAFEKGDAETMRVRTLSLLEEARDHLETLSDDALGAHRVLKRDGAWFPVWNIMNGPLADALTHVGQLNSWRRLNGNPARRVDVFSGIPPENPS